MSEPNTIKATTVKGGTTLVIIDGQIDFHPGGALAVQGADEDAKRIANLILSSIRDPTKPKINRIVATMDSHHRIDICHHKFWLSKDGTHPTPGVTQIKSEDIENGTWTPVDMKLTEKLVHPHIFKPSQKIYDKDGNLDLKAYCIEYLKKLEEKNRFPHIVWPDHCLIGTEGHCMEKNIYDAMLKWSTETGSLIEWVHKGQNPFAEMYSALKAEVEICPATRLNHDLLNSLKKSDHILICGQAMSHCVNHTTRDLIDNMEGEEYKVVLLEDCSSPVIVGDLDFTEFADDFKQYVKQKGGRVCESTTVIDVLSDFVPPAQEGCCLLS